MKPKLGYDYKAVCYDQFGNIAGWFLSNGSFIAEPLANPTASVLFVQTIFADQLLQPVPMENIRYV